MRPAPRSVVAERCPARAVTLGGVMGLLDDAIREHLELKRQRGADADEIERAEHEALEPIFPDERPQMADGTDVPEQRAPDIDVEATPLPGAVGDGDAPPAPDGADFANVGQETAELDMQAVLDADLDHSSDHTPPPPAAT